MTEGGPKRPQCRVGLPGGVLWVQGIPPPQTPPSGSECDKGVEGSGGDTNSPHSPFSSFNRTRREEPNLMATRHFPCGRGGEWKFFYHNKLKGEETWIRKVIFETMMIII